MVVGEVGELMRKVADCALFIVQNIEIPSFILKFPVSFRNSQSHFEIPSFILKFRLTFRNPEFTLSKQNSKYQFCISVTLYYVSSKIPFDNATTLNVARAQRRYISQ